MKKTTCKQLAGACDTVITGETPEEMAKNCQDHAMEMVRKEDDAHLDAMTAMKVKTQEEQEAWYQNFLDNFNNLEEA